MLIDFDFNTFFAYVILATFMTVIVHEAGHAFFDLLFGFRILNFCCWWFVFDFENKKVSFEFNIRKLGFVKKEIPIDIKSRWIQHILTTAGGIIFNSIEVIIWLAVYVFSDLHIFTFLSIELILIGNIIENIKQQTWLEEQSNSEFYAQNKNLIYEIRWENNEKVTYVAGTDGYSIFRDFKKLSNKKDVDSE